MRLAFNVYLIYIGAGLHNVPGRVHVADHRGSHGGSDLRWSKPYAASSCRAATICIS
jgi:hypothetical protein